MTVNPLQGYRSQVYMLAVLRYADKTVIASYCESKEVTKEGIRECVAGNAAIQANKKYTAQGEAQAIHYSLDAQGRVYAMVTNPTYSARVAFIALEDLQKRFGNDFGPKVASSTEESLSRAARPLLKEVVERYAEPSKEDQLAAVQMKVDIVKSTMQENIQQLLLNEEKMERIEAAAVHLNETAGAFQKGAKQLKDEMWWKMIKMRLLIAGLIIVALLIIIVPTAVSLQKH